VLGALTEAVEINLPPHEQLKVFLGDPEMKTEETNRQKLIQELYQVLQSLCSQGELSLRENAAVLVAIENLEGENSETAGE
jgi:hypothetical protein